MRVIELRKIKTEIKNKTDALKRRSSHIEESNDLVRLKIKERKLKKLPSENPFDFTEYLENENEENEIDLDLILELAEENKILYNQVAVNSLIENME